MSGDTAAPIEFSIRAPATTYGSHSLLFEGWPVKKGFFEGEQWEQAQGAVGGNTTFSDVRLAKSGEDLFVLGQKNVSSYSGDLPAEETTTHERLCLGTIAELEALRGPSEEKHNEKNVLAEVQQDGRALSEAPEEMKSNEKIVLAAVQETGYALQHASEEMKSNEKIVLAAVQQNGYALQHASEEMKNNEKIVQAAVGKTGRALQYASEEMKNNEEQVEDDMRN